MSNLRRRAGEPPIPIELLRQSEDDEMHFRLMVRQKIIASFYDPLSELGLDLDQRMNCIPELMYHQTLLTRKRIPDWSCKDIYPACSCKAKCYRA